MRSYFLQSCSESSLAIFAPKTEKLYHRSLPEQVHIENKCPKQIVLLTITIPCAQTQKKFVPKTVKASFNILKRLVLISVKANVSHSRDGIFCVNLLDKGRTLGGGYLTFLNGVCLPPKNFSLLQNFLLKTMPCPRKNFCKVYPVLEVCRVIKIYTPSFSPFFSILFSVSGFSQELNVAVCLSCLKNNLLWRKCAFLTTSSRKKSLLLYPALEKIGENDTLKNGTSLSTRYTKYPLPRG